MTTEANDLKLLPPDVARAYADQLAVELIKLAEAAETIAAMARLVQINVTTMLEGLAQTPLDGIAHANR